MSDVVVLLIAYFLGSIPFGLLLTKAAGLGDVRAIGSGNIGATNVLRTGNKRLAAATLALDMLKGLVAVLIARYGAENNEDNIIHASALMVVAGHIFPLWLRFRGGKGVATAIGALLGLHVFLGLFVIAVWLAVFKYTRISSLSALCGFGLMPLAAWILLPPVGTLITLFLPLIIAATHRANILRLIDGTELRFTTRK